MSRSRSMLILFLPLIVVACGTPEVDDAEFGAEPPTELAPATPADVASSEAAVEQIRNSWVEAALAGDAAAVASLYAEDARMVGVDGEVADGRQAIQDALAEGFQGLASLEVNSAETVTGNDVISDMGSFTQTFRAPDGQEQTVSGQYLVVLRRQADGSWKLVQHLVSIPQEAEPDDM
jgi:uncharacterized protein (TIGR02246 family)